MRQEASSIVFNSLIKEKEIGLWLAIIAEFISLWLIPYTESFLPTLLAVTWCTGYIVNTIQTARLWTRRALQQIWEGESIHNSDLETITQKIKNECNYILEVLRQKRLSVV